jgi:hypothetical protein
VSLEYEHIATKDTRCWCAPQKFTQDETISQEVFPGVWMVRPQTRVLIFHYESNLHPRRHGHPRKPRANVRTSVLL